MTHPASRCWVAGALLVLSACVIPPARVPVDSLGSVATDETVIVGRVEVIPPLSKEEQKMKALNSGMYLNRVFVITDEQPRKLTKEPVMADYKGRIEATLGKTFFVRSKTTPFYVIAGVIFITDSERVYLPGGLKVPIKAGDKAVYIGTIQYHRDEFWDIKKASVIDDYDHANAEFKKKFGTRQTLRKALVASK